MAFFPLFMDLSNKKCIIVGGGEVATRKAEKLSQFCNNVTVVSPEITEKMNSLIEKNKIKHINSEFSDEFLEGTFLIVLATSNRQLNNKLYKLAIERNIYVNTVDNSKECTFTFPAIVRRDDLVVGISTSAGYPLMAKEIKKEIDRLLPNDLGKRLSILTNQRRNIKK